MTDQSSLKSPTDRGLRLTKQNHCTYHILPTKAPLVTHSPTNGKVTRDHTASSFRKTKDFQEWGDRLLLDYTVRKDNQASALTVRSSESNSVTSVHGATVHSGLKVGECQTDMKRMDQTVTCPETTSRA